MRVTAILGCAALAVLQAACSSDPGGVAESAPPPVAVSSVPPPTQVVILPAGIPVAPNDYSDRGRARPSGLRDGFARCAPCHSLTPGVHGIGPSLAGVFGRGAGLAAGYRYSPALSASGLVWDAATLDLYLRRPRDLVRDGRMAFAGMTDSEMRAEVIAFLQRH